MSSSLLPARGRFANILVTGSPGHLEPAVLRAAVRVADANDARLTVVDVVETVPRLHRRAGSRRRTHGRGAAVQRHQSERLRALAAHTRCRERGDVEILEGEPCVEVIRRVMQHGHDLVIVGVRQVKRWVMPEVPSGLVTLLRQCPVPVWVMYPTGVDRRRILALIDPDPHDPVRDGLNDLVLVQARSFADVESAELHVGHAWTSTGRSRRRSSREARSSDRSGVLPDSTRAVHAAQVGALLDRHGLADGGVAVHLVDGAAGEALPKLAGRIPADLMVVGTVARTGLGRLVAGNTAEAIVRSAHCSVLVLKPEGVPVPVTPAVHSAGGGR